MYVCVPPKSRGYDGFMYIEMIDDKTLCTDVLNFTFVKKKG